MHRGSWLLCRISFYVHCIHKSCANPVTLPFFYCKHLIVIDNSFCPKNTLSNVNIFFQVWKRTTTWHAALFYGSQITGTALLRSLEQNIEWAHFATETGESALTQNGMLTFGVLESKPNPRSLRKDVSVFSKLTLPLKIQANRKKLFEEKP